MSDYISKSEVLNYLEVQLKQDSPNDFKIYNTKRYIEDIPTLDEKEIIRKAFERVVERLELLKYRHIPSRTETIEKAIEILKEECGISE